jgi:hypothetical protein
MIEKVYPTIENKATLICPQCKKSTTVDVSKYTSKTRAVKINSTCSCGYKWTAILEKRKKYRKPVNLSGTYDYLKDGKVVDRGGMKVVDLSFDGVKIMLNVERNLPVGDHLRLEFYLDDVNNSLIKKNVTVRNVSGRYVGATFRSTEAYDPVLGFYLMTEKRSDDSRRMNTDRRSGGDSSYNGPEKRAVKYRRSGDDRRQSGQD